MRHLAALLVAIAAAFGAAFAPSIAQADPAKNRARIRLTLDVVDRLQLDHATAEKILPLLSAYTRDRDRLLDEYSAAERRLDGLRDPNRADAILDQMLATQSALVAAEAQLVVRLRGMLPQDQAARARVMLADPPQKPLVVQVQYVPDALPPHPDVNPDPLPPSTYSSGYDPEALFPPGSSLRRKCDPFESMHGCRY